MYADAQAAGAVQPTYSDVQAGARSRQSYLDLSKDTTINLDRIELIGKEKRHRDEL
jgi:hypothetical protein